MDKLVNYSSSSDDEENSMEPVQKKIKLPMPFKTKLSSKRDQKEENPAEHQGRKRQIPHIEGNWSCHVYIDCYHLKDIFREYFNHIKANLKDIEIIETPHVSLSKNFIIKYHWIENLSKILAQNLKFTSFRLKFTISKIEFLSNEDNSRHFVCILINKSCENELKYLVEGTNKSLKEFELPPYYQNLIFHVSILWKLKEFSKDEKSFIRNEIGNFVQNEDVLDIIVEKLTFKTGNKTKYFNCD